ncbi:hypothetical protein SAMD00019534_124770 [Acytostelium subglobosum LB1]|uniref:hypothetical protein n=1 Tax=Acytostelium subglobosum LB1 TaxID=1410327 RepID=UPI000644D545|nr:hypothetical protein SAMD00019534_124770 [Acytostelium subglobosum LB1]GAM29301.1 hypothetical protein SAMD00019534_124770 [Acytostelium subglobosum LB1]|eukprot:XP_012747728.1 hypothetical protein SAMD00019534_124770 [Acytostelium subglobosum LB1]
MIKQFNKGPDQFVQTIDSTTYDKLINLLHIRDDVNKVVLGVFLGGSHPTNKKFLNDYVNGFEAWTNKEFDETLREFLARFRLPKEAQQIDRIMECFAHKYARDNPDRFSDPDTAYLLAFSLILLNTDAHNINIKHKMSKRVFVHNNLNELVKGKNSTGGQLTADYLGALYDRIIASELKIDSDTIFSNALMKGWLHKMSSNHKKHWQRRWFVLKNNCIYYFSTKKNEHPKVIIPLEGLRLRKLSELSFEIHDATISTIKSVKLTTNGPVEGNHQKYMLKASSPEEANKWMESIASNILGSPVILLIKRKKRMLVRKHQVEEGAVGNGSGSIRSKVHREDSFSVFGSLTQHHEDSLGSRARCSSFDFDSLAQSIGTITDDCPPTTADGGSGGDGR